MTINLINTNFQAYCPGHTGRSEPSFGRKRREANTTEIEDTEVKVEDIKENKTDNMSEASVYKVSYEEATVDKYLKDEVETPSHVRKMIEVRQFLIRIYPSKIITRF